MKITFLFSVLAAASVMSNLRSTRDNLLNKAKGHYYNVSNSVRGKALAVKEKLVEKFKKQKGDKKDANHEQEEDSEQMREFLEQITKHFAEIQKQKAAEAQSDKAKPESSESEDSSLEKKEREEL